MSSQGSQKLLQGLKSASDRFFNLSKQFEKVARQIEGVEKKLHELIDRGTLVNRGVFEKIVDESNYKIEPIEKLSESITSFVERLISNTIINYGEQRRAYLLEQKEAMLKTFSTLSSPDSVNTTAASGDIVNELKDAPGPSMLQYEDGIYIGDVVNNYRHGRGKFKHRNGNVCIGTFNHDVFEGDGEFYWANQNLYKGQFKGNRLEGRGVVFFNNGEMYEGDFSDDDKHGQGIFYYKDGTRFNGQFFRGKKHGFGIRHYHNEERYEGLYQNDKRDGKGTYFYSDGSIENRTYEKGHLKYKERIHS